MKRLLLCSLLLAACGPSKPPAGTTQTLGPGPADFKVVSGNAAPDDIALFLAGQPVRHGAALSQMQQSGNYQGYAGQMGLNWRVFAAKRTARQRDWSDANIRPLTGNPRVLLYPFGGPDLLHAASLFPNTSTYVLFGLEPTGSVPALEQADPGAVYSSLRRLDDVMESEVKHGYFITEKMRSNLSGGVMPGVTPVLLAQLGLMGATVNSVQSISAGGRSGVDIRFKLPGSGSKRAIYVSGDLSNGGFSGSFRNWVGSFGGGVAYFKAASYLMHDSSFSGIRDWVLGNCHAVVQDDSGIPYRYYDASKWNVRLFGDYDRPIELFTKFTQADLRAAYDTIGGGPALPFGSGYQVRDYQSNLLIAVRR
ncbi:hypothetical protein [Luteolibacter marinus]|uniref:hypothetical protein n=1 Tax=Luteolibacter marinus TaxID=2776705 RepID=UPI0018675C04|nr:hypothetical protein [Luteolibacter marinus]